MELLEIIETIEELFPTKGRLLIRNELSRVYKQAVMRTGWDTKTVTFVTLPQYYPKDYLGLKSLYFIDDKGVAVNGSLLFKADDTGKRIVVFDTAGNESTALPSGATYGVMEYRFVPVSFSDDKEKIVLPDPVREMLIAGVLERYYAIARDGDMVSYWRNVYQENLKDAVRLFNTQVKYEARSEF